MKRFFSRLFKSSTSSARRTPAPRGRLQAPEALEDRCVPATLQLLGGVLTYDAAAGVANNLTVSLSGATYTFRDTAETINVLGIVGATGSGTNVVTVPAARVAPAGMRLNLGDKNDLVTVESTANAILVKGGADNDTIDIGKAVNGSLSPVQALVTVDGEAGQDRVRVNDTASGAGRTYTVTAAQVTPSGGFDVAYATIEDLLVSAGNLADTFNVRSTAAGTTTTLSGGAGFGSDTFNVGNIHKFDDIKGALNLLGGPSVLFPFFRSDVVNLFDSESTVGRTYTLGANSVARNGAALISYSGLERVTLHAGTVADTVVVQAASTPVTLNLGDGNDRVILGNTANTLDGLLALVTVNGQAGSDTIALNDQGANGSKTYIVTATDVSRDGRRILSYATSESLKLNASNFADAVFVQSTLATTPVALALGGGDDSVVVGFDDIGAGKRLAFLQGALSVDGQAGTDDVTLDDRGSAIGIDYTVTGTTVARAGAAAVTYAGEEKLTVFGANQPILFISSNPTGGNFFRVKSTSVATTLNGAVSLNDFFVVGSDANSLDDIRGALTVNGQHGADTLTLNDQGDADGNSYSITSSSVQRGGAAAISYTLLDSFGTKARLTLNAGAGNDTVRVTSTAADTLVSLNMGGGNDTVTLDGGLFSDLSALASTVTVSGQGGADAIVLDDSSRIFALGFGHSFTLTALDVTRDLRRILAYDTAESLELRAGAFADSITVATTAATTPVVVKGGTGNDVFKVGVTSTSGLNGAVTIDGQGGSDTLDYSAYSSAVRVNLAQGTATGVAGGVSNVENVTGGQGNDILVGNDQANVLRGGPGRDILIGRGGPDTLLGEAGDDILIGSSTVHDLNAAALESLMSEWGRFLFGGTPQQQYTTRINHLLGVAPGGLNGTTFLDLSKVTDDGVADSLDGGLDLDWFFKLGVDTLVGLGATERVN